MSTSLRDLLPALAVLSDRRRRSLPPLSLNAVADLVALSPHHAQRTFRRIVGESPKQYQLRLRLDRAAVRLLHSDRSVTDIAFDAGFKNHETFTRAFTRRFGRPPSEYRRAAGPTLVGPDDLGADATGPGGPAEPAERAAPCVGLYRAPLPDRTATASTEATPREPTRTRRDPATMSYEIEIKTLPETPLLYIRRRADLNDVAGQLAEILPAVFGYVIEAGLPMAGPPVVRHVEQSAAFVTLDGGIPLAEAAEAPSDRPEPVGSIQAGTLSGGEAAVTIHTGPYDTLGEAHAALDRWVEANGRTVGGPPWEVYLTDPGEVPDPADWQTEVVWPLAP